jgi:hypothetical protein
MISMLPPSCAIPDTICSYEQTKAHSPNPQLQRKWQCPSWGHCRYPYIPTSSKIHLGKLSSLTMVVLTIAYPDSLHMQPKSLVSKFFAKQACRKNLMHFVSGINAATGEYILFTDMDQSTPISELDKLMPHTQHFGMVIGSRGARRTDSSLFRQLASVVFLTIRRLILLPEIKDTQCGFKLSRTSLAKEIFDHMRIFGRENRVEGWKVTAYDVEMLHLAKKLGEKIKEVRVIWKNEDTSSGKSRNFVKESIEMFLEILRVRVNDMLGKICPMIPISIFYLLSSLIVFVYSYGFLDFNLTLSSNPYFLQVVSPIQALVYFERYHSVRLFVLIFALLFIFYLATLFYIQFTKISIFSWKLFLIIIAILILAYPMLSYDVFNYMFHSKILWFYHQNPHLHAPLEYSADLWLRFMRWVHTPSAYGPIFTLIESPAYLLGLGKFVPTLYLMKLTMAGFFVWCVYLVGKIGKTLGWDQIKISQAQFMLALNPFLLFELVINAHNDAVMIAFLLFSILKLLEGNRVKSVVALMLSVGVKFMTALTFPLFFIRNTKLLMLIASLALYLPVLLSPGRFQPWYLVWCLIPAVLIGKSWSNLWFILTSLAGLIYYIPYVGTGFWNNSLPFVSLILYLPPAFTLLWVFVLPSLPTRLQSIMRS